MELVAGVALAGVGTGLAVYAAKSHERERQLELLRPALRAGLTVSALAAVIMMLGAALFADTLTGGKLSAILLAAAALAGCISVIPGTVSQLWQGMQRRERVLALTIVTAILPMAVVAFAPAGALLWWLVGAQALPALVLFAFPLHRAPRAPHPISRYVLPGISIGVLSPASLLVARATVGDTLSWHDAGVLQAVWRVAEWVGAFAWGVGAIYYLPQLAAAQGTARFDALMRRSVRTIVLPAAVILAVCFALHRPLLGALYDETFVASDAAVLLLFAGSLARVASWIPLIGLYVRHGTRAIAIGELFSLPLFALLVLLARDGLTLERVGAFWLFSFCAYAAFNGWALRRL